MATTHIRISTLHKTQTHTHPFLILLRRRLRLDRRRLPRWRRARGTQQERLHNGHGAKGIGHPSFELHVPELLVAPNGQAEDLLLIFT